MVSPEIEDYLEAVYTVSMRKQHVRTKDIAALLNVKPASVSQMMKKLGEKGLVNYERYGLISLTMKGRAIAKEVRMRHDLLLEFLGMLQVRQKTAERDSCSMEHSLQPETVRQLLKFVEFSKRKENSAFMKKFREYSRKKR